MIDVAFDVTIDVAIFAKKHLFVFHIPGVAVTRQSLTLHFNKRYGLPIEARQTYDVSLEKGRERWAVFYPFPCCPHNPPLLLYSHATSPKKMPAKLV
jgi:hypothetical protein